MSRRSTQLTLLLVALMLFGTAAPAAAQGGAYGPLQPGAAVTYRQTVPVNIVLVGFKPGAVNTGTLLGSLPERSRPVVRAPLYFYGLPGRDLGLEYQFRYRLVDAGRGFEDDFFAHLAATGHPGEPTTFQQRYNEQERNLLDVTGPVLHLDGPAVERWLMERGRARLGINPDRSYTLYLINWYGRPDFRFHAYQSTAVTDPDTGVRFGELDGARSMAWGGSHGRTWFYDLSAGPELSTRNFIVDTKDLDGDGEEDYRMPPIWEYAPGGYRDPSALSADLGKVARFVAINQLFAASAAYDPLVTGPAPGGAKFPFVVTFRDNPSGPRPEVQRDFVIEALRDLQPYYAWKIDGLEVDPIDAGAQRAFRIAVELLEEDDCWNALGFPFAQLFCFFSASRDQYLPPSGPDYVIGSFVFDTTTEHMGSLAGAAGTADDNWEDGTQSFTYTWTYEQLLSRGRGPSWTVLHEAGHHLGLSHPFDGYDPTLDIDYAPLDDAYAFVGIGLQTDSVMSVQRTSTCFGQFDRDALHRFEFAGYMNWSNALLGAILASPEAGEVRAELKAAARTARLAERGFQRWDFLRAAASARATYETLQRAADQVGVSVDFLGGATQETTRQARPERAPARIDWVE